MPTAPQIESWFYTGLPSLRQIQLKDSGGGPITFTLSTDNYVEAALADWQGQANVDATLAETYTIDWSASTQQVRFAATGNFELTLDGSLPAALGFSSSSHTGASLYASDETPKAIANPININYQPPWPAQETQLRRYRWGRTNARAHHRAMVTTEEITMLTTQADVLLAGPMFASKLRLYPCGFTSGAYAANNLRGFHDVYPYEIPTARPEGSGDNHTTVIFVASAEPA
jgi:hypothetical protein